MNVQNNQKIIFTKFQLSALWRFCYIAIHFPLTRRAVLPLENYLSEDQSFGHFQKCFVDLIDARLKKRLVLLMWASKG